MLKTVVKQITIHDVIVETVKLLPDGQVKRDMKRISRWLNWRRPIVEHWSDTGASVIRQVEITRPKRKYVNTNR